MLQRDRPHGNEQRPSICLVQTPAVQVVPRPLGLFFRCPVENFTALHRRLFSWDSSSCLDFILHPDGPQSRHPLIRDSQPRPSPFSIGQPSKLVEPREINQRTDPFQTEKSSVAPHGEPAVLGSGTPRFWSTTAKLHPCRPLFHCATGVSGGSNESSRASPFYK